MITDPQTQTAGIDVADDTPPADDMASLLDDGHDYRLPHRGEIVEGTLMSWDREGALVDIGAKSEGLIMRNEMQSLGTNPENQIKPGEKVIAYVVQPEGMDGQIILSLDRARGERGWHTLQERFESGETFEAQATGFNRGGLLVNVEGVNAFVPLSQLVGVRPDRSDDGGAGAGLQEAVGKPLRLKVIEINRRRNRVILSERAAMQEWRSAQKERLIQELREGDIRRGRISSVRSFGVFVDLGGADGLAHLSELSWDRNKQPSDLFHVGDEVDVYITKIDSENKKIALSLRRAKPEQWDAIVDKYKEDQVVPGVVTKLVNFGAFARIEGPVEGLIHVSELVDRRIGHPKEVVREGDLLPLKIVRVERDRHRLGLSLRRAREEGEQMGFVFSDGGEVMQVPEDIRAEFEAREGPIEITPSEDESDAPVGYDSASASLADAETGVSAPSAPEASTEAEPATAAAVAEPPAEDAVEPTEQPETEEPVAPVEPEEQEQVATVEPEEQPVEEPQPEETVEASVAVPAEASAPEPSDPATDNAS